MNKSEYKTISVVSQLDILIKSQGYKSKQKFGTECTSLVCEQHLVDRGESCDGTSTVSNIDRAEVICRDIETQLNTATSNDDFMNSCKSALSKYKDDRWKLAHKIKNYKFGFLAVLVNNYIKKENAPEKPDVSHLGWIGYEGKRGKFFVKLTELIVKEDYTIHKVVDKTGNRGLFYNYKMKEWKNNADDDTVDYKEGIEKNDCFLMTATPSRHQLNKYDGGKETYFNRITIEENKGSRV